jgi:hypothetical protein
MSTTTYEPPKAVEIGTFTELTQSNLTGWYYDHNPYYYGYRADDEGPIIIA